MGGLIHRIAVPSTCSSPGCGSGQVQPGLRRQRCPIGCRVAQHVAGRGVAKQRPCRSCAGWRPRGTGCAHCGCPPPRCWRPRRCWSRPGPSRLARRARPAWYAGAWYQRDLTAVSALMSDQGSASQLTGRPDRVRRVMEEPNGHRAEHVTGGIRPADHDDRFVSQAAAWGARAGKDCIGGRARAALECVPIPTWLRRPARLLLRRP